MTGDAGFHGQDGGLYVMGRAGDIFDLAGHRLPTGGMEEVPAGRRSPNGFLRRAAVVARLPKTCSGRSLRGTSRRSPTETPYAVPATIDDPATLGELT